jgi:hypothetical protein
MKRKLLRRRRKLTRFAVVLDLLMAAHNSSPLNFLRAVGVEPTDKISTSLGLWRTGVRRPRIGKYLRVLESIETAFELPRGRLADLVGGCASTYRQAARHLDPTKAQLLRWHTPADFDFRTEREKNEIISWVYANVLPCATDYGRRRSDQSYARFSIVFPTLPRSLGGRKWLGQIVKRKDVVANFKAHGSVPAPQHLVNEMLHLVQFFSGTFAPKGYRRRRRWADGTVRARVPQFGTVLGSFATSPNGKLRGLGVPLENLTMALFVFPQIWDWWLDWCEQRRGFFSGSEKATLNQVKLFTRKPDGWLRQSPELSQRLNPIHGLITANDIDQAKSDWGRACDEAYAYACIKTAELTPLVRISRDPVVPILPVLEAASPLRAYKKIGIELLRLMPDEHKKPIKAAVAVRDYLMFRLALHLGIRSRNLRELLLCPPGRKPRATQELEVAQRGELRWNSAERKWEVYIPAIAIKNGSGSFFGGRPYYAVLPDVEGLYYWISCYIERHRSRLLHGHQDPGTFFVRNLHDRTWHPEFDVHSFQKAWTKVIQYYGIYNPYTKRGAIKGLLPHGPHVARDVLATHLLKTTGSYELAASAIQDSIEMVSRRYARFLPNEKIARAAKELNKVWK